MRIIEILDNCKGGVDNLTVLLKINIYSKLITFISQCVSFSESYSRLQLPFEIFLTQTVKNVSKTLGFRYPF